MDDAAKNVLKGSGIDLEKRNAGGKWMLDHGERAGQLMADPLFEIGNHSWSHANMRKLGRNRALREIRNAQAAYEQTRQELSQKQCVKSVEETLSQVPARIGLSNPS